MGLAAGITGIALPLHAQALTLNEARELISRLVADINSVINSGAREQAMYRRFEGILQKYADVPIIARSALGVEWRSIDNSQRRAFTEAFQGYLSRKYGKRFREFIGGEIRVQDTRKVKSFYEVVSVADLRGEAPFEVLWHVSDKSGKPKMFNLYIEGINMLATERTEIGAMLDKRGGNVDALIQDLRTAG
ncbi:phospholipid-binding protein MlaC [Maritimibacter sp. 55A14]|uniref:MlaC/ttg2D family ABC transporter substrate-binding protein n=1 Tax=Maritimibacter sp. 55A14 TaxID=2174844 RepID=UPI001E396DE8|nr:ABC transporter substrate-binding protein [Maritimibacter sp. 55A14]